MKKAEAERLAKRNIAMRVALIHAREFAIQAIKAAVKSPGFDPAKHDLIVEIDAALKDKEPA